MEQQTNRFAKMHMKSGKIDVAVFFLLSKVLMNLAKEGKIPVSDPASYGRSMQEWDLEVIVGEAAKAATSGGSFWAVGKP